MKKLMCVLLCVICISSLVGCGKNSSELDFSETIRSIDFSMTLESVKNSANDTLTEEKTAKGQNAFLYYEGELNGYSGEIIYRFDADTGTLDFIKFKFNSATDFDSYMDIFKETYGEPSKVSGDSEMWYGVVGGENAVFATYQDSMGNAMVEVDKK